MKRLAFPMNQLEACCGRSCSHDQLTFLVTRIGLVEGDIIKFLEDRKVITLRELMEFLDWEPCIVAMAVGALLREGVLKSAEFRENVFLELSQPASLEA